MEFYFGLSDIIQIFVILIMILLSAFFSSAETAMTTVNKLRIKAIADEGNVKAVRLLKIIDEPSKMLSAILIGNNLVNIATSALATTMVTRWLMQFGYDAIAPAVTTVGLTLLVLFFGEITPKTLATLYSEQLALAFSGIISGWIVIATPLIYVLHSSSQAFLKLFGIDPSQINDAFTEEDIRNIVEASHEDGEIESEEREMINNVFDFDDSVAKDIMVPKVDISFFNVNATYDEILEQYRNTMYTRYPVYEENSDNVIGIINIKDILLQNNSEDFILRQILRPVLYTHELKNTSDLFKEMRKQHMSLAIVLDEYGITSGIVTIEDIIEEIVGEINDEYDDSKDDSPLKINDNEYEVSGAMSLDDLIDNLKLEELGLTLQSEGYDSVGGLMIELLDHLPEEGEEVCTDSGIKLRVDSMQGNHIEKVHVFLPEITIDTEDEFS